MKTTGKSKIPKPVFPSQIYVGHVDISGGRHFYTATDLKGFENRQKIGIYKLVEVRTVTQKVELI